MKIECPECGGTVTLNQNPLLNEILECVECGVQLIVSEVNPELRLEIMEDIGEDWGE